MAKRKFNHVASMEKFPMDERLFMVIRLDKSEMKICKEGRSATDAEVGTALWRYHGALNDAEAQIKELLKIVKSLEPNYHEVEDYLEEYPDNKSSNPYLIQEEKAALFQAMAQEDQKAISDRINRINILKEKEASNG